MLVNRFRGVLHQVLEVAGQLFGFEKLLGIEMLIAQALVLDAINQREPLATVDGVDADRKLSRFLV